MKKNVMVSIDQELHKEAKERQFNVSSITDKALRLKMHGSKRDVPEDAIQLKCTQCGALIDYGFLCQELKRFYCQECQNKSKMNHPSQNGEHSHIRIPGFAGQHMELLSQVPTS